MLDDEICKKNNKKRDKKCTQVNTLSIIFKSRNQDNLIKKQVIINHET